MSFIEIKAEHIYNKTKLSFIDELYEGDIPPILLYAAQSYIGSKKTLQYLIIVGEDERREPFLIKIVPK